MTHFNRFLLIGFAALFLAACSDSEQAQDPDKALESADKGADKSAATEGTAEQAPAAPAGGLPAPENVDAPPEDAVTTESGLAYIVLDDVAGEISPVVEDTVTVHYTGWTTDGNMFDSSVMRGEPATFPLNKLIPGWKEAIPLMTIGDTYRFWIPGNLAYDNSARPGAPKGTLVFDIELLGVSKPGELPGQDNSPDTAGGE